MTIAPAQAGAMNIEALHLNHRGPGLRQGDRSCKGASVLLYQVLGVARMLL